MVVSDAGNVYTLELYVNIIAGRSADTGDWPSSTTMTSITIAASRMIDTYYGIFNCSYHVSDTAPTHITNTWVQTAATLLAYEFVKQWMAIRNGVFYDVVLTPAVKQCLKMYSPQASVSTYVPP